MSCKYADSLGIPGKGAHKLRLGGVAIIDLVLTLILALGLSYIPGSPPLTIWIIILLLFSMSLHALFCTKTSVNHWLYNNYKTLIYIFTCLLMFLSATVLFLKD